MSSIGKNLAKIHSLQRSYLKPILDPYHVPANSFSIILNIGRNEGISQKQLCEVINMDEGLVARLVKKLEEQEIIYKKRNTNDLRAYQLFLTEIGKELYPQISLKLQKWWDTLLLDLPQDLLNEYIITMTQRAVELLKEEK